MAHLIDKALIEGLTTIKVPLKYREDEFFSLERMFDSHSYNFFWLLGSEGSQFLQTVGYEFGWWEEYYYVRSASYK